MKHDTIEAQITRLFAGVESVERAAKGIEHNVFLAAAKSWSPRDIVAHLIGWNRAVVAGGRQLQRSELPFYDEDPGEDYANVNAAFVREHSAQDRTELLRSLRVSASDLADYLRSLSPDDWSRDFGVRHGDELLTIRGTAEELVSDYATHDVWSEN